MLDYEGSLFSREVFLVLKEIVPEKQVNGQIRSHILDSLLNLYFFLGSLLLLGAIKLGKYIYNWSSLLLRHS